MDAKYHLAELYDDMDAVELDKLNENLRRIRAFLEYADENVEGVKGTVASANNKSNTAVSTSTQAKQLADDAIAAAEYLQQQLDAAVINAGNANPEVAQARANFANLRQRLDEENTAITQQLAHVEEELNDKVPKVAGKQLSTNDYSNTDKGLVNQIPSLARQDFVDAQFTSIVSGAPKGTYTDLVALKAAYPNGAEGVFLTLDNGHWHYWSADVSDWLDGGVYQATGTNEFTAKNLITNGDFANGLTGGWAAVSSTHNVSDNALNNIADGTQNYGLEQQALSNVAIGDKIYITAQMSVTNDVSTYLRLRAVYSDDVAVTLSNPIKDRVYVLSGVFTTKTNTVPNVQFLHGYADAATANGKTMRLQRVVVVNLTEIFGEGNEPKASEIDAIMNEIPNRYFNGTIAPFVDNKTLYKENLALKNGTVKTIVGTANQINVTGANTGNPQLSITFAPQLLRPEKASVLYGVDVAPTIGTWAGNNGATLQNGEWDIPVGGFIHTMVTVVQGQQYELHAAWSDTVRYELDFPRLKVFVDDVLVDSLFGGYSDANYTTTFTATKTGQVKVQLSDATSNWWAVINNVTIKPVTQKVTSAGKIGYGNMDIYTNGDNLAIGGGHKERTSGTANTAVGFLAQQMLTVGKYNFAGGVYAQQYLTSGFNNVSIGHGASRFLKSGYYNIAFGYMAMMSNVEGSWNIAIGNESMRDMVDGDRNTAVGSRSYNSLQRGRYNVAMGRETGLYPNRVNNPSIDVEGQTLIGSQSGQSSPIQANNLTVVGFRSTGTTNALALGAFTRANAVGAVAIGTDDEGNAARASEVNEFVLGTEKHNVKVLGTLNIAQYTPTSSSDSRGKIRDITTDDNYFYAKTASGWKRAELVGF